MPKRLQNEPFPKREIKINSVLNTNIMMLKNEKLEFDLKSSSISINDTLEVELKDHETIGTNKYFYLFILIWNNNFQ